MKCFMLNSIHLCIWPVISLAIYIRVTFSCRLRLTSSGSCWPSRYLLSGLFFKKCHRRLLWDIISDDKSDAETTPIDPQWRSSLHLWDSFHLWVETTHETLTQKSTCHHLTYLNWTNIIIYVPFPPKWTSFEWTLTQTAGGSRFCTCRMFTFEALPNLS